MYKKNIQLRSYRNLLILRRILSDAFDTDKSTGR